LHGSKLGFSNDDELSIRDVLQSRTSASGHHRPVLDDVWYDAPPDSQREAAAPTIDAVVERIIGVESYGDPNAKNKRSSATGLGQFLDETWLDMIRAHRPDLAKGRSQDEILELRRDAKVAREITARFTQRNAEMLRKRGLPVTP